MRKLSSGLLFSIYTFCSITYLIWRLVISNDSVSKQRRLIWAFCVLICTKSTSHMVRPRLAPRPWCHVLSLLTISWFKFMYDILYSQSLIVGLWHQDKWKGIPKWAQLASWPGAMINPQWFKLLMSRITFRGSKHVRAIEVRLYLVESLPMVISQCQPSPYNSLLLTNGGKST